MRRYFFLTALALLIGALPGVASARSLSYGMTGSDVTSLQQALIGKGYSTSATGYFGPQTLAAVKKFQCDTHIVCSGAAYGLAGPATQGALGISSGGGVSTVPPTQNGHLTGKMTAAATGSFEFSGWIPDWRAATATADVMAHTNQLKSVMPFSIEVNSSGQLIKTGEFDVEPWASMIAQARASGARIVPTILWGNADAMQNILSNSAKRIALEDAIANLVKAKGWDGIDIDFEGKHAETINYFSTFLKGLYQRMGNKWVYCTVESRMPLEDRYLPGQTVPPDATNYANDYVEMNKYCDRIEIMAYDQGVIAQRLNAARVAPYAPVADPGWVENVVRLAAQTISRNKIILGIPTYGYEYTVTPKPGGSYEYDVQWPFNPKYATDLASQLGITPYRTSANELGFVYTPTGTMAPSGSNAVIPQQGVPISGSTQNQSSSVNTSAPFNYVTWSDATAIKDKVDLARRLGLRGVALFSLSGGQDPLMWSVLR